MGASGVLRAVDENNVDDRGFFSPSAYGVFGVVYDGRLLSYQPIGEGSTRALIAFQGRAQA